jgi:hypothetical protein
VRLSLKKASMATQLDARSARRCCVPSLPPRTSCPINLIITYPTRRISRRISAVALRSLTVGPLSICLFGCTLGTCWIRYGSWHQDTNKHSLALNYRHQTRLSAARSLLTLLDISTPKKQLIVIREKGGILCFLPMHPYRVHVLVNMMQTSELLYLYRIHGY